MKYLFATIILCSISYLSFSQVGDYHNDTLVNYMDINKKKQGKWVKKYDNGQIRYKGQFKNDKPIGTFYYYFNDGQLKSILDYDDNGNARCEMYHENGNIAAKGKYNENRERIANWEFYYENGETSARIPYENNKANGKVYIYYTDGSLLLECNYNMGTLDGEYKRYFRHGAKQIIGTYKDGSRHGHFKFYDTSDRLIEEGPFVNGLRHGTFIDYDAAQAPDTIEYINNRPENWEELNEELQKQLEDAKNNQHEFKHPEDYYDNPIDFFRP